MASPAAALDEAVPVEHRVDRAIGRGVDIRIKPPEPLTNLRGSPVWLLLFQLNDELLDLKRKLVGFYDPEIGRFTAPDPIVRVGQGLNRYAYSRNSPISFLDPSGLDCITVSSSGATMGDLQISQPSSSTTCTSTPRYGFQPTTVHLRTQGVGVDEPMFTQRVLRQEACNTGVEICNETTVVVPPTINENGDPERTHSTATANDPTSGSGRREPMVSIVVTDGEPVTTRLQGGLTEVFYGGYKVELRVGSFSFQLGSNVLGSEAFVDPDGNWHEGPLVSKAWIPVSPGALNSIAGTPLGRSLGFHNPVKYNNGGLLQPYNASTGKFMSYSANDGLNHSEAAKFTTGTASGFGAAQGVPGPTPVGVAGRLGYMIGYIAGTFGS